MLTRSLFALVLAAAIAAPALAGQCPSLMRQIDAALPQATLDEAKMAEVKQLRAEGEAHHQAGRHGESVAALNRAKSILGID